MSAREVHVRIGRLVVDAPLRLEAADWDRAIEHALRSRLTAGAAAAPSVGGAEAIAQQVAARLSSPSNEVEAKAGRKCSKTGDAEFQSNDVSFISGAKAGLTFGGP